MIKEYGFNIMAVYLLTVCLPTENAHAAPSASTTAANSATVPLPQAPDLSIKGISPEELKAIQAEAARQAQAPKAPASPGPTASTTPTAPSTSPAGPSLPPVAPGAYEEKKEEENEIPKPLRSGSKPYSRQSYKSYTLKPGYAIQSTPAERSFGK